MWQIAILRQVILLVCASFVWIGLTGCDKPIPVRKTFSATDGSYQLSYPESWKLTPNPGGPIDAVFLTDPEHANLPIPPKIWVTTQPIPALISWAVSDQDDSVLQGVESGYLNGFRKSFPDAHTVKAEWTTIAGIRARRMLVDGTAPTGEKVRSVVVYCMKNKKVYFVAGTSKQEDFDKTVKNVESVVSSFTFLK